MILLFFQFNQEKKNLLVLMILCEHILMISRFQVSKNRYEQKCCERSKADAYSLWTPDPPSGMSMGPRLPLF